ncbi:hypothetical protein JXQ70_01885 [bacterium]|nr:hypothetical protein [bacterium]
MQTAKMAILLVFLLLTSWIDPKRVGAGDEFKQLDENCYIIDQRCDDIVRPTEWGFELTCFKFGQAEKGGVIRLDADVVEHVRNVVILLDKLQLGYCKHIQAMSECSPSRDKHFANQYSCQQAIQQLIVLAQCYSEKRLRIRFEVMKWIVRSSFLIENLDAKKLLPEKFEAPDLKNQITAAVDFACKDLEITVGSDKYREFLQDPFLTRITARPTEQKQEE